MKQKQKKGELAEELKNNNFFGGALFFSLFPLMKYLQDGTSLTFFVFDLIIICIVGFLSFWSQRHRIEAIAYLIGTTSRFGMFLMVCITVVLVMAPVTFTWIWLLVSFIMVMLSLAFGGYGEYKGWQKRIELWEKYKKINLQQGHYNILVRTPTVIGTSTNYLWMASLSPLIVVASMGFFKGIDRDIGRFVIFVGFMYLSIILAYFWAVGVGILIELCYLQKKYKVIFKTEYRDLIKMNKK